MKPPPPRFPASGTVTASAKAVATAASIALPPARSTVRPTSAAWASWATTACLVRVGSPARATGIQTTPIITPAMRILADPRPGFIGLPKRDDLGLNVPQREGFYHKSNP